MPNILETLLKETQIPKKSSQRKWAKFLQDNGSERVHPSHGTEEVNVTIRKAFDFYFFANINDISLASTLQ